MAEKPASVLIEVQRLYATPGRDVDFGMLLSTIHHRDDMSLAELIETDGRLRIADGRDVTLERYLSAVPDLYDRPDALDAAIDVTLRCTTGGSRVSEEAVERLTARFPELKRAIREAATLNAAIWSTTGLRKSVEPAPTKALPCDFGPLMPEGKPRYELQKLLGQGAFGQVYLALDRQLSEADHTAFVAIKILAPGKRSPWARQRMIDEATKARRISHPNVVLVHDRGVSNDDEDFIVYEYVDGGDLSDRIGDRAWRIADAVQLVAKIARGVHAAHSAGVIHCDLKPGNIMMNSAGEPKVADFGIAVRLNDDRRQQHERASESGGPIGNLAFVSPEQYRGEDHALSVQSDVYAIGGMLYLLLTGQLPNGSTLDEIARTHHAEDGRREAPVLRPACSGVDADLEAICRRALQPDPQLRQTSAAQLADDLERWLRREPIAWTKPGTWRVMRLWARRKPALAASLVVIIALAIAGGVVLFNWRLTEREKAVKDRYTGTATRMITTLKDPDYRFNTELLPMIWALEYFFGPTVIGTPELQADLWKGRIAVIRRLVQGFEEQGRGTEMEPLLWKSTLAFWLVCDRNYAEAETLLEQNYALWQEKLKEDSWLKVLRSLRHCAAVDRLANAARQGRSVDADCRDLQPRLFDDLDFAARYYRGSQIHLLLLERTAELYGPALLNDQQRQDDFAKMRQELLAETPFKSRREAASPASQ